MHLGTIGACKRCFSLPMRPNALLGFCRAKLIGFDIGLAAFDTFAFIWCHKNPSMHLESLHCVKPLAAMGLSARAIQTSIETPRGTEDEDPTTFQPCAVDKS